MKTKLETQATKLWQSYVLNEENNEFWNQYDQLVKASRKIPFTPPPLPKGYKMKPLGFRAAYTRLPKIYYSDLLKKEPFFNLNFSLASIILTLIVGGYLFPDSPMIGRTILFSGLLGFRYLSRKSSTAGKLFTLDIRHDHLMFGPTYDQKKILYQYIQGYAVENNKLILDVHFPQLATEKVPWRRYKIPILTSKNQKLPDKEIGAIKQLLAAIVRENKRRQIT